MEVRAVDTKNQLDEFIELPWKLYQNEKHWVPPLRIAIKEMLDEKKCPFYRHGRKQLFVARDDAGRVVGRIGAFFDQDHVRFHNERAAFFGFFECDNNQDVSNALIQQVKEWARNQGAQVLRGPFNLNSNYETGLLVDGFDDEPYVGMNYNPKFYEDLLLGAGFRKAKDLNCYYFAGTDNPPEKLTRIIEKLKKKENITTRAFDMSRFDQEVETAYHVYNNAWENNWGFIPFDPVEFEYRIREMKPIIEPQLIRVAERDGEMLGFSLAIPDVNRAFSKIKDGKLFPTGLLKLLWYTKGPKRLEVMNRFRIIALGVKKEVQHLGIGGMLYYDYFPVGKALKMTGAECSWVLEDNHLMNRALQMMGARLIKTYRLYELNL